MRRSAGSSERWRSTPRDSWALRSRISFLRSARRFEEAERAAAEALERRPDDLEVRIELGGMHDERRAVRLLRSPVWPSSWAATQTILGPASPGQ